MRIVIRLLSFAVIVSAAVTLWTRAALAFVLGPQLTAVFLWIAAGGSLCAVITLALTRKPNRPQPYRPPEPLPASAVRRNHDRAGRRRQAATKPGMHSVRRAAAASPPTTRRSAALPQSSARPRR